MGELENVPSWGFCGVDLKQCENNILFNEKSLQNHYKSDAKSIFSANMIMMIIKSERTQKKRQQKRNEYVLIKAIRSE